MAKRYALDRGSSDGIFERGIMNVHPKNGITAPMRGGIRL